VSERLAFGEPVIAASQAETSAQDRRAKLERFFKFINRVPDILAVLCTVAMLVCVLIQICTRLMGRPVAWTEEATRFLFIWMIFLGLAAGFRHSESARVTFFINLLPKPARRLAPAIHVVVTIGFFLLMLVTGTDLVVQQIKTREMGSALMIPLWTVGICVPISAVLGILGVLESVLLHPETLTPGEDTP